MALPKRKTSKKKKHQRSAANWKLHIPGISECPQCHAMKLSHRACPTCGYYNGRHVMDTEKKEKAE